MDLIEIESKWCQIVKLGDGGDGLKNWLNQEVLVGGQYRFKAYGTIGMLIQRRIYRMRYK